MFRVAFAVPMGEVMVSGTSMTGNGEQKVFLESRVRKEKNKTFYLFIAMCLSRYSLYAYV